MRVFVLNLNGFDVIRVQRIEGLWPDQAVVFIARKEEEDHDQDNGKNRMTNSPAIMIFVLCFILHMPPLHIDGHAAGGDRQRDCDREDQEKYGFVGSAGEGGAEASPYFFGKMMMLLRLGFI